MELQPISLKLYSDFVLGLFPTSQNEEKFVARLLKLKVGINISKFSSVIITLNLMTRGDVLVAYNGKIMSVRDKGTFPKC